MDTYNQKNLKENNNNSNNKSIVSADENMITSINKKSRFTSNDIINMKSMYDSGNSLRKIAKYYGVHYNSIYSIFKKNGFAIRSYSYSNRKHYINENYFDNIDTQNKAYFLGLLFADGCNCSNNRIILSLQEKDKHILESLVKELECNYEIKTTKYNEKNSNWQNQCKLDITNKHMSHVLYDIGMVYAKSLVLDFPKDIPEYLIPHFLRGYMDGDGCIYFKEGRYFCSITSTEKFCLKIQDILSKIGVETHLYNTKNENTSTRTLYIWNKDSCKKFLDYIYNDAELYLFRKYNIYINKFYKSA